MSSTGGVNWSNRTLFHGDNLPFLRAMNSNTVHLIATDPPFNKGRDFHATPDSLASGATFQDRWSWEKDVHHEWVDQITDDQPRLMEAIESARYAHSDGMGAFMCFMAVRLMEMRRVLRQDGSIYLHCDPTASHYLKAVMDAIFGKENFRNEIIWKRATSRKIDANRFGNVHDVILFYSKTDGYSWNTVHLEYDNEYLRKMYRHDDGDGRGPYSLSDLTQSGPRSGESGMEWRGISMQERNKHWITPTGKGLGDWIVENAIPNFREIKGTLARLDMLDRAGLIYWPKAGKGMPRLKRYLASVKGPAATDVIENIGPIQGSSKERTGYPTQKPIALYERIVKASSNDEDIVLDPFCGCATTLIAAERLGRQWVGIDIWDKAHDVVIGRLKQEGLTGPDGDTGGMLFAFGEITYTKESAERTDDAGEAVPFLQVRLSTDEPGGKKMSRAEMYEILLSRQGPRCQGCDRVFDDTRYLELDHNTPRSDGGLNHISNRILLCSPGNRAKSNQYTLSGLKRLNQKNGWMSKGNSV